MLATRRWLVLALVAVTALLYTQFGSMRAPSLPSFSSVITADKPNKHDWSKVPQNHPVSKYLPVPTGNPASMPAIQAKFTAESPDEKEVRLKRQAAVKASFQHTWAGYTHFAWGEDEVIPHGGGSRTNWGGWAATLIDSLDTLWIMDLKTEFRAAVKQVAQIDFTTSSLRALSLFETTIRFLGGLLSAYDLSGEPVLLQKATDLGEMLYKAFDTPNRMPVHFWDWRDALEGAQQMASSYVPSSEIGSLSMEFTRLSQLTGDPKYFDAVQRITEYLQYQQNNTELPGIWPIRFSPASTSFDQGSQFGVGALADSLYEYLVKEHVLLGGGGPEYLQMYENFLEAARKHLFFRVPNPDGLKLRLAGEARVDQNEVVLNPMAQHLTCFIGGLVAVGGRLRGREAEVALARELTDGCVWAYGSTPSGIMPEQMHAMTCSGNNDDNDGNDDNNDDKAASACAWDLQDWYQQALVYQPQAGSGREAIHDGRLPPGFTQVDDPRYLLRPEAIESVFVLFRVTADPALREAGWRMFEAVERAARTDIAYTELADVMVDRPPQNNKMESFWTGETLKYFYLLFSEPDLISLDEYVLNTEAHPFRYRG